MTTRTLLLYRDIQRKLGGVSLSTVKRLLKQPGAPAGVPITGKMSGWFDDEIDAFLEKRRTDSQDNQPSPESS